MLNKTYTLRRNPRMKMTAQNEIPPDHFVVTQADLENMFAAQSSMDGHDNSDRTKGSGCVASSANISKASA